MSDYIKLRMMAAKRNSESKCGQVPAGWDDAFRPASVGRSRWYEDVLKEIR